MDGELDRLGERIAELAAHLDAASHRLLADLREFDERGGWHLHGAMSCAHWLSWRVGWTLGTARDHVRVAGQLGKFPTLDDALRRGEVSYSKLRAITRVATPANETMLLEIARLTTASDLEKLVRKYALVQRHCQESKPRDDQQRRYVRRRDTEDGMVKIEAVLHPEEAEMVWTMLDHAATAISRGLADSRLRPASTQGEPPRQADVSAETAVPPGEPARQADASAETAAAHGEPVCQADASTETAGAHSETVCKADASAETAAAHGEPPRQADVSAETAVTPDQPARQAGASAETAAAHGEPPRQANVSAETPVTPGEPVRQTDASAETAATHGEPPRRAGASAETAAAHGEPPRRADVSAETAVTPGEPARKADASAETAAAHGEPQRQTNASAETRGAKPGSWRPVSVLQQREDATKRAFNRADALVSVAQDYLRGDQPNRSPIEITVSIPASSLRAGEADPVEVGEVGASFVASAAIRRLSCDAGVIEVVEDEHGTPLSVGRKQRTVSGALKRALRKRDTACTFPGCTHRIFLEGHHIKHWADGGETSLMNVSLLCSGHHRYVHEYGYTVELGEDQRPRFRDPQGRLVSAAPAPAATGPELGWPRIHAMNAALAIDANTIACGWDGSRVDYGTLVGQLVKVDGLD